MARLELGADGMVRFDGRIIAEITYFDDQFANIIEAADDLLTHARAYCINYNDDRQPHHRAVQYSFYSKILEKAGWWKFL